MRNPHDEQCALCRFGLATFLLLAGLTAAAILVHGYHFGFDDQSVYLPAVKKALDPSLYPYDAAFFLAQTRLSVFAGLVAQTIRLTRIPLDWAFLLWHCATVFLLLAGCWRIARRCFRTAPGICGSLLLLAALLTLPVAGTFVALCDPYLHSRALATALLLMAFADALERRPRIAVWVILAALIHPVLAAMGLWHIAVQLWPANPADSPPQQSAGAGAAALLAPAPAGWLAQWFADPSSAAWREALSSRRYLFPRQWTWYEQLGAFAPLGILWWFARAAESHKLNEAARVCRRMAISGGAGVAVGYAIAFTPALLPLVPLEPMRVLHLVYLLMVLFAGGLGGELLAARWKYAAAAALAPLAFGMFFAQRTELDATPHIEWPGTIPRNDWREAFEWIRMHTPRNALFAMNPAFLALPGENEHGFRGLAERGQLAEAAKDRAVSRNIPGLAWAWRDQVHVQQGIDGFDLRRLEELRKRYGVTWLLLWKKAEGSERAALDCPFENATIRVCRAP